MTKITLHTNRYLENDIMTFLSQTDLQSSEIISFGSGKPDEHYFRMDEAMDDIRYYMDYQKQQGLSSVEVYAKIGQYTHVKGIIPELIKSYWETDYQFQKVDQKDIILTVGAQEAFVLAVLRLCEQDKHTIICENPSYIGINSFAELNGYAVNYVDVDSSGGISLDLLENQLQQCQENGKPVKLVYLIPDFHNPTGSVMPLAKRKRIIALSEQYDFHILEDNAYGVFRYEGERIPYLKELDIYDRVLYVESFSKSIFPSIRLAAMYATGEIWINDKKIKKADLLAEFKAYISVNTATLDQALVGGILLKNNYSLQKYNEKKIAAIKAKRDVMLAALAEESTTFPLPITYNVPQGGFFLELNLPFAIDEAQLNCAITKYHVVFCPMWFFYQGANRKAIKSIRLSFSKPSTDKIKIGINNLFTFFKTEML